MAAAFLLLMLILAACDNGATPTPGTSGTTGGDATPTTAAQSGGSTSNGKAVVVSSKDFPEEVILGELYAVALEAAGVPVERKLNLGSTDIAQAALVKGGANGGIDLYPEYTGTGLLTVLKGEPIQDYDKAYQAVKDGYKQFKLTWLDKTPMNDTQAVVTTKENSDKLGIKTLQDLCDKASTLTIAARPEFKDRSDALPALQKIYGGCQFKDVKVVSQATLLYKSLTNNEVDVAQADGTAGEISGYNLVLLGDPKNYGPPDNVAPVVRDDVLAAYPQIADVLNRVSAKITNEEMTAMNWQVSGKGAEPRDVAKDFLYKQGLLPK